ncbi:hypothetical protein B566_EDAN000639 [Ephemera danica]|nr:hypothetical protein B566_EDAN000639 [Ephemera danica]
MDNPGYANEPASGRGSVTSVNDEKNPSLELESYGKSKHRESELNGIEYPNLEAQHHAEDPDALLRGGNSVGNALLRLRTGASSVRQNHHLAVHRGIILFLHLIVISYVVGATCYWFIIAGGSEGEYMDMCDGLGMVYILAGLLYFGLFYFQILKPYYGKRIDDVVIKPSSRQFDIWWEKRLFRLGVYLTIIAAIVIFLIFDTAGDRYRLVSCTGVFSLIFLGFIFSKYPGHIRWRPVFWGLGLQFLFGLLTIRWAFGQAVLQCVGDKVTTFLSYTDEGTKMVYGDYLITTLGVFAFKVLPVIFFFSFCIQILYYYGVMQWIVLKLGWLLQVTLGTTVCESVNTSASIFLGQSEAPLIIRPYIKVLTRSELHAIMTGGFATIAGTVMAAYLSFGVDASHLITASVMSAPAALCYSKLFYPETEKSQTTTSDIKIEKGEETSALDAAAKGANDGIQLWLLGKAFIPLAFVMGVRWEDCPEVATLIGLKTVDRSAAIATYALCGFSNPGSIGIMIGALSNMAPNKRTEITEVAFRAFIAGSAACFLTACVAEEHFVQI